MKKNLIGTFIETEWHWESFKNTLLGKYYINNSYFLYSSAHEDYVLVLSL